MGLGTHLIAYVNNPGALHPFCILWKMRKLEVPCFSEIHSLREKPKAIATAILLLTFPTATSAVEISKSRLQHQKTDSKQKETIYILAKTASTFKKFRIRLRKKKYL